MADRSGPGSWFLRASDAVAHWSGSPFAVAGSVALVVVWGAVGPLFGWSEGHQLFINTVTTVITFWLVFVIQATQNRDSLATQAKLDALIKAVETASNRFIGLETHTEAEIEETRRREIGDV